MQKRAKSDWQRKRNRLKLFFSEGIVVGDDNEYVWPYMELSMMVLVAHTQRYIEDIVEAYIFKELHDLAY